MKEDQFAFPGSARLISHDVETGQSVMAPITQGGMSLRAYFAGQALQGLLNQPAESDFGPQHFAQASVAAADALIAELNKTQQ